ncbi:MAG: ATP-binding protein [Akkermansiaceae bacterium]|nr:ATP-binding protein [Akkermansiaceae bacterium]
MRRILLFALIAACLPSAGASAPGGEFAPRSIAELEHRLALIDVELRELAHTSLNSGVGPIGYRSLHHGDPDHAEWVEVDLGAEGPIDEVVLVPTLWRSTARGFVSDAFPAAFRIVAGTADDRAGTVVAEFPDTSSLLPRVGPLVVPVVGTVASWVRIEATRLSPRAFDGSYIFQLSELLVFAGEENRALRRPVTHSGNPVEVRAWSARCLVDGILPYVMNAAEGEQSRGFLSMALTGDRPSIDIDLGERFPVSGLRLHATDQSDTAPQAFSGDFGLPRLFRIAGADEADFSDARELLEVGISSPDEAGPIMEWNFGEAACRYVRLIVLDPYVYDESDVVQSKRVAFAEIEVLSAGRNVAVNRPVTATFGASGSDRDLVALTDGRNLYGKILPLRQWLGELARRHDLETERPRVTAELASRYARQKTVLTWVAWLAAILAAVIGLVILYYRERGRRQETRIRERIAANLHDDLGANLHAIGLLGDLAKDAVDSREELVDTVDRIRTLTERTGSAARNCANMLEARDVCEDLVAEMRRDSESLLADLKHDISFEGEEILQQLARRRRIDLFLFHKECLANVIRHSGATEVETRVVASPAEVRLTVTDNGEGFAGQRPESLKRRARLLGADFEVQEPESGGTRIVLKMKTRKYGLLR